MGNQDREMPTKHDTDRDKDELEFIRVAELNRRTKLLIERDGISHAEAREKAEKWISDDTGQGQLSLPIEPVAKNVYRIYYRQLHDDKDSEYRLLNAVVQGTLYDWPSTHTILADIIRNRFDKLCDHVIVFHPTSEHNIDLPETAPHPKGKLDEFTKHRRIADLEEQIRNLKEQ